MSIELAKQLDKRSDEWLAEAAKYRGKDPTSQKRAVMSTTLLKKRRHVHNPLETNHL
jgi:hypothetical protein